MESLEFADFFLHFVVGVGTSSSLVESSNGKVLKISEPELVQAIHLTMYDWHHVTSLPPAFRPVHEIMRAVEVFSTDSILGHRRSEVTPVGIPLDVTAYLTTSVSGIIVSVSLNNFVEAAMNYLAAYPRLYIGDNEVFERNWHEVISILIRPPKT